MVKDMSVFPTSDRFVTIVMITVNMCHFFLWTSPLSLNFVQCIFLFHCQLFFCNFHRKVQ